MIPHQPTTPHSDSPKLPGCSECGTATQLFGIEAERPGYELRTFICPKCEHVETAVGEVVTLGP
jgi:hypothetical protein